MKFNWGTGIFIFYSLFVVMLVFIVWKSTQYDHSLVVEDYYAKDLAYQSRYDQIQNSIRLDEKLKIEYLSGSNQVQISFPDSIGNEFSGNILFYRADNKSKDKLLAIQADIENDMMVDVSKYDRGRWKVQIDWAVEGVEYFDESTIYLR